MRRWTFIALLLVPTWASADGMTLEQLTRLERVTSVASNPSGTHIAYTLSVPRTIPAEEDGAAWSELHVIGPDGESTGFVTGQVNVAAIDWMPNGRTITFLAKRGEDESRRLYGISINGGEARVLASLETDLSGYSLSPDGSQVALLAFEPEDEALKTSKEQGFTQIVYEEGLNNRRLYLHTLDGDEAPAMLTLDGSIQEALWSPDGDRLAIKITPRQLVDDVLMFNRIRIIDLDGDEIGRVENPGKLGQMAWSPDGEHLAFIATNLVRDPREGRLMSTGKSGGEFNDLIPGLEGHVWHLDWLNNDQIIFVSYEGVETRVGLIDPDGDNQRTLLNNGPIFTGLSVADNGVVMTGHTPAHPPEVFRLADGAEQAVRLTRHNDWLDDVELTRREVVRYAARDGLEIEGVLFYPLDYREGRRYPLIVNVHGGPEAHYQDGWITRSSDLAEPFAAEGFFVFYQNYRGSTGRGVEFTLTSQARPAMEEFDDLIDGVDYLVEQGLVDAERVGITGGSYGGYATAWGATKMSDRFAAAVMNVGLASQITAFGTSDIPYEFNLVHLLQWPWENWDLFHEASPLYHVENAKTPILIMHGDADPRVDPVHSRMLYRFLKLQENPPPVRLVLYQDEGHGNQRAASRYDYSLRLMRWMNHYLKGEGGQPPPYRVDYKLDIPDED